VLQRVRLDDQLLQPRRRVARVRRHHAASGGDQQAGGAVAAGVDGHLQGRDRVLVAVDVLGAVGEEQGTATLSLDGAVDAQKASNNRPLVDFATARHVEHALNKYVSKFLRRTRADKHNLHVRATESLSIHLNISGKWRKPLTCR